MRCPRCGSTNCQVITDTYSEGKDYSAGKGCCGVLLAGPAGILCGFCGEGRKTKTRHYWVCTSCGRKWRA